jgi:indolepyruvate decarboxylase
LNGFSARTPTLPNDVAPWRYSEIPHALGCDGWFMARVTTRDEFDKVLKAAEQVNTRAYIEVVTDTYAASPFSMKLHERLKMLYRS